MTNHNLHITEKLEVLANAYNIQGDKWRALGYAKAINALKSFHKPVSSYQVRGGQSMCQGYLLFTSHQPTMGLESCG